MGVPHLVRVRVRARMRVRDGRQVDGRDMVIVPRLVRESIRCSTLVRLRLRLRLRVRVRESMRCSTLVMPMLGWLGLG